MAHADLAAVDAPRPIPDVVTIDPAAMEIRMSPNELRQLKADTGRNLSDLLGEGGDDADRLQTTVWLSLRRDGFDLSWNRCGDIAIEFSAGTTADPTNGGSTTA
jgi:hypothetical protein